MAGEGDEVVVAFLLVALEPERHESSLVWRERFARSANAHLSRFAPKMGHPHPGLWLV